MYGCARAPVRKGMRFRTVKAGITAALLAVSSFAIASEASAQSFFEQLFGLGSKPQANAPANRPNGLTTPGGRPYSLPSSPVQPQRRPTDDDDGNSRSGPGTIRTVCVRMCDGYYFPVSNATNRKGLYRDYGRCAAQCGEDAKLFQLPAGSLDMSQATDNNGRTYGSLKTAFLYRKTLVSGCQCRQPPWSETEVQRHRVYAEAAEVEKPKQVVTEATPDATAAKVVTAKAASETDGAATPPIRAAKVSRPVVNASAKPITFASRPRLQPTYGPKPVMIAAPVAKSPAALSGGMGLGAAKMQWPGDTPRRP